MFALLRKLGDSPLGDQLILAGSSGLYGASETIPALTEDVDVVVDADWVAAHETFVLQEMERLGFRQTPQTCTFSLPDGMSLDLVGYSREDQVDRIGGGPHLPIMVFGDLSRLLSAPESTIELSGGGRALSPAALAASKLLTVRLEKGSKDKLQALLLIEENADDPEFLASLRRHLSYFDPENVKDALADAQMAALAVAGDVMRADVQSSGYVSMSKAADEGLRLLRRLWEQGL
ncbi:MAG: hypothetical protein JF614_20530 [Acidobacteria bacterium]|nr:hypothetical protein [Acidobacteriota bacterium]